MPEKGDAGVVAGTVDGAAGADPPCAQTGAAAASAARGKIKVLNIFGIQVRLKPVS